MSRVIKFRVWDTKLEKFISINSILCIDFESKEYIFQQFTNQKDKNDNEIYDGDLVEVEKMDGSIFKGVVTWCDYEGGWIIDDDDNDWDCGLCNFISSKCEIKGNVYDKKKF
jgi:hypothetical protein